MKERMENYWNNRANTYSESIKEELCCFKKDAWKSLIKKAIGDKTNIKVLDLGTGPGFFAIIMSELGYDVTAVDCSKKMLNEAKGNAEVAEVNIEFLEGDIDNLDFIKEKFDLIISRNVTWTLKDPINTYRDWYDLLDEEGKLLIFDANWYLRLSNSKIQEEYIESKNYFKDVEDISRVTTDQEKECESMAKDLPLTYKIRPEWDEKALLDCGFNNVIIDKDITEMIYTEKEKIAYKYSPMFSICAYK